MKYFTSYISKEKIKDHVFNMLYLEKALGVDMIVPENEDLFYCDCPWCHSLLTFNWFPKYKYGFCENCSPFWHDDYLKQYRFNIKSNLNVN